MGLSMPWASQPCEACELLRPFFSSLAAFSHTNTQTPWMGDSTPHDVPSEGLASCWQAWHHMADTDKDGNEI